MTDRNRQFARSLRREMTEAEDKLWHELRDRRLDRIKFRRQMPIGKYIADFVCVDARLVVEIDGSQHADSAYDEQRKAELKARGFRVLRFWNDDVLREMNSVCETIIAYVRDQTLQPWRWMVNGGPAPPSPPVGEGVEAKPRRMRGQAWQRRVNAGAGRSSAMPCWNTPHPTSLRSATFSHRGSRSATFVIFRRLSPSL